MLSFYNSGYQEGFAHGALHGTFEGRALGKEKAFELWEEVGYYEGMGRFWKDIIESTQGEQAKERYVLARRLVGSLCPEVVQGGLGALPLCSGSLVPQPGQSDLSLNVFDADICGYLCLLLPADLSRT